LSAFTVTVAPLRDRREQILTILSDLANCEGLVLQVDADAAEAFLLGHWPTNVCGLQRLVAFFKQREPKGGLLDLRLLRDCEPELVHHWKALKNHTAGKSAQVPIYRDRLRSRSGLQNILAEHSGNVAQVARELGTTRAQVYRWMARLGLDRATARRRG
jgi:transcriptional regulator of acetoin/glycerol metabolism